MKQARIFSQPGEQDKRTVPLMPIYADPMIAG
jgi:hypothetical protein